MRASPGVGQNLSPLLRISSCGPERTWSEILITLLGSGIEDVRISTMWSKSSKSSSITGEMVC